MSEENESTPTELDSLKSTADKIGLKYHPTIGVDKLRVKVKEALNDEDNTDADDSINNVDDDDKAAFEAAWKAEQDRRAVKNGGFKKKEVPKMSTRQKKNIVNLRKRKEATKLIRVRISCMNTNKKNMPGEIMSVSNAVIGTISKFVPFGLEAGYHLPMVLYKHVKNRKYASYSEVILPNGQKKQVRKMLPEFGVEVLTPLNEKEREALKQRQLARKTVDD